MSEAAFTVKYLTEDKVVLDNGNEIARDDCLFVESTDAVRALEMASARSEPFGIMFRQLDFEGGDYFIFCELHAVGSGCWPYPGE